MGIDNTEMLRQPRTRKTRVIGLLVAFVAACSVAGVFTAGLALPVVGVSSIVTAKGAETLKELPANFTTSQPSMKSVILAADGTEIAQFFAENRIVVPLEDIPKVLQQAVISIEDRRFLEHRGVDVEGMSRAVISNLAGNDLQGASTLTQQYVKNLMIEQGRVAGNPDLIEAASETTLERKAKEARLALTLEQKLTKAEILEGYLNIAQFGPSVYGVEAASRHYFSKPAQELSLAEASLLAGIPQSPNGHDPIQNPKSATIRQKAVLAAMLRDGFITASEKQQVEAVPVADLLKVSNAQQGCGLAGNAAYFCSWVVGEILSSPVFGPTYADRQRLLLRGGLEIHTTLDLSVQNAAYTSITSRVPVGDPSKVKIAISAVEPGTGQIKAMAQNTEFGVDPGSFSVTETSYNVDAKHGGGPGFQTGSTFKAFTLAQWYIDGYGGNDIAGGRYLIPSREWRISCAPDLAANYDFSETGGAKKPAMSVSRGTAYSINGVFVNMASKLDLCDISKTAAKLGVTDRDGSPVTPNPAFVLGSETSPPLNMANAYATFASHGVYCRPIGITSVKDSSGKNYPVPSADCHQALTPDVADKVATTLQGVLTGGAPSAALSRPAAGKTGTTDKNDNTWFVGFVPQLSSAIWVGHSDGNYRVGYQVIGGQYYGSLFGSTIAAPTWRTFMNSALEGQPVMPLPRVNLGGGRFVVGTYYKEPDQDDQEESGNQATPAPGSSPARGDQGAAGGGGSAANNGSGAGSAPQPAAGGDAGQSGEVPGSGGQGASGSGAGPAAPGAGNPETGGQEAPAAVPPSAAPAP